MFVDTIKRLLPHGLVQYVPRSLRDRLRGRHRAATSASYTALAALMDRYTTEALVNTDAQAFRRRIDEFLSLDDFAVEGYQDPSMQRDLSMRFHWGHDHDFGEFKLAGRMRDRHIALLTQFMDEFDALPLDLTGLRVLDIGCWTGGTSLLLHAMGAEVYAIEEVRKYADCAGYLADAFGLERLQVENLSLYDLGRDDLQDRFDIVLFAGVLYHVTDPVIALRHTFNVLKDGGTCLVETAAIPALRQSLEYEGPTLFAERDAKGKSRGGWNWFVPSTRTLARMMADVGYTDVRTRGLVAGRAFAVGKRQRHVDILRAGLSVRDVR